MNNRPLSNKHILVNKANAAVVIAVSIAAFFTTFSLVASRSILAKRSFQSRVIAQKEIAAKQLKDNIEAVSTLNSSYQAFIAQQENIIAGSSSGVGERDGDNAKIILDALPSKYDFPALANSLDKIFTTRNYKENSIVGTDDEIAQAANSAAATEPIEIPIQMSATSSYAGIQDLLVVLDRSIRPINIKRISLNGNDLEMQAGIDAKTYYQPDKKLNITTKVVK